MPAPNTLAVNCANTRCTNTVTVVSFGFHNEEVHVKVSCKECYVPVVVAEKKENERVDEGCAESFEEGKGPEWYEHEHGEMEDEEEVE
jgi:hypothetical protein